MALSLALAGILLTTTLRLIATVKILFYPARLKANAKALHVRLNRNKSASVPTKDSKLGKMDILFLAVILPFMGLILAFFLYLLVSKVTALQKIWTTILFAFSILITAILAASRSNLPYFAIVIFWIFPLITWVCFAKWCKRKRHLMNK
ncbi:small-conductance mechanosensitive channel [Undibacterium sp. GrIS 1.8]